MNYPKVAGEYETVKHILKTGCSIARFGDGEVKLMSGGDQIREPRNPRLAEELIRVMTDPDPRCIVGVPTLDPKGPKFKNWEARGPRTLSFMRPDKVKYYSAFISRPDSSPWILTREYAELVTNIWRGRRTAIICEEDNKLYTVLRSTCSKLKHFTCPHTQTYNVLPELEYNIEKGKFDLVVMSCGPAATCLAHRLSKKGVQGIDLGSAGGMLLKLLELEPLGDLRTVLLQRPTDMTVEQMKAKLEADWTVKYFEEKGDQ